MSVSRGSEWRRWEPHIHAPGTVLNNQFGSDNPWEEYLTNLESRTSKIEALGITDYYLTDTYENILHYKFTDGRLPDIQLIFPNVEIRLNVAAKSGFVNAHLLVSPDDSDHLEQLKRILSRFRFSAFDDEFGCTKEELIRLGKCADSSIIEDQPALEHGATQFKVDFDDLRKVFQQSDWAKKKTNRGQTNRGQDMT